MLLGQTIKIDKENSAAKKVNNSSKISGGFKYRPEENKKDKIENNLSYNASQIDKHTVYDEFGLINESIGKKKYREP